MVKNNIFLNNKVILLLCIFLFIIYPIKTNAVEIQYQYTKEYLEWLELSEEEKKDRPIPQMISTNGKINKKSDAWTDDTNLVGSEFFVGENSLSNQSRFNLAEHIDIEVKYQGATMECWAFSTLSSMETNLLYKKGIQEQFSERHMDYATSSSFYDVDKESLPYVRDVSLGGLSTVALAYLTNGQGAVYETQMPFEDSQEEISIEQIDISPSYYVTDYVQLPSIYKSYNKDGSVKYLNAFGQEYTIDEVNQIRKDIKEYIVNNGALTSVTASNYLEGYNNQEQLAFSTAFCCKDSSYQRDHAIAIVGWDDNYSKDNFSGPSKPTSDGAYIILQSYGNYAFDNGYMYISYEDNLIESLLYGVTNSEEYDYYNLYQNDYYGANGTLYLKDYEIGNMATTFKRDSSKIEYLNEISFNLAEYASVELWVNPNNSEVSSDSLIKVSEMSDVLTPGYHTIKINPIELTGDSFAVAIKQKSESGDFYFNIEFKGDNIMSVNANSEPGRNKISIDGVNWSNLEDLSNDKELISTADLCIKAFTIDSVPLEDEPSDEPAEDEPAEDEPVEDEPVEDEPNEDEKTEVSSDIYKISSNYIKNISVLTTAKEFFENIKIKSNKIEIYDNNEKIELDTNENLKTGMKLVLDDNEYILIIKGDISCDGKISLLDLSKLLAHYAEIKDCEITGIEKEAGDMNLDDKISLIDLSRLLVIYSDM